MKLSFAKEDLASDQVGQMNTTASVEQGSGKSQVTYDEGEGQKDLILMSGPLSDVYTKALGVYFAKKPLVDEDDGGKVETLAQESQANDAIMQTALLDVAKMNNGNLAKKVAPRLTLLSAYDDFDVQPDATVFVVDNTQVNQPQTVQIVEAAQAQATQADRDFMLMVVDVDADGHIEEREVKPTVMNDKSLVAFDDKFDETTSTDLADGAKDKDFIAIERLYEGIKVCKGVEGFVQWLGVKYKAV